MSETDRIVLPTDFSEASLAAVPWARRMSEDRNAELHCVTAVQQPVIYTPMGAEAAYPSIEELVRLAEQLLDDFVKEHCAGLKRSPVAKVLVGRPADEIIRYASDIDAEMIVMATHGYSGLTHLLIGSTTEGVVRQAKCPVLTVRSS
jgi:universal stress protein A